MLQDQLIKLKKSHEDLVKINNNTERELIESRKKLAVLVKENDSLRQKVLKLEEISEKEDKAIGKYVSNGSANGRIVYQGSQNGRYYLTPKGTKTYIRKSDKIEELDDEETF